MFTKSYSDLDGGSTRNKVVRSSVLIEVRIEDKAVARCQSIRISEDYAQQLVKELGSSTGVEFVPGIGTGQGSISSLWCKEESLKKAIATALKVPWTSISVYDFPEFEITVSDAADGKILFTLIGVAIQNQSRSVGVGNNFISQDVSFGFIDILEGDA